MSESNEELSYDFVPRELSEVDTIRHSTAHLLASAVAQLYPGTKFAFGPAIEHGFYYDMELPVPLSNDDLPAIEERMREIAKGNHKFEHFLLSKEEAISWAKNTAQTYKLEAMENLETPAISFYKHGDFTDMCAGPHVNYSKKLKHFKLTHLAGAYWRGDEHRPMLTRIYGLAFDTKEALDAHVTQLEEAKKRDHRKLGPALGLFMFHEYAPGAAFWLERGEHVYHLLAERMRGLLLRDGYISVRTPMLFDKRLWETSGHWEHYQQNMFHFAEGHFHEGEEAEGEPGAAPAKIMALKAMNCPSHMLIFKSRKFSYRDLPFRVHDQGVLHRNELRGALGGLTRVRQFCQDDAHLFCAPEQMQGEVQRLLDLVNQIYAGFGMKVIPKLSTRPESRMGDEALWDQAESALKEALDRNGIAWKLNEGDGTFYGPKIDFDVLDAIGRAHQCATIQVDFQMPLRFGLQYTGADNQPHTPVVLHRAILGSFERFIGILVEHYAGRFPVWLAPEQVRVLTVSEKSEEGGRKTLDALHGKGLHATLDDSAEKIGYKIREAHAMLIPYMAVIGEREQETGTVAVRSRDHGDLGTMALAEFVERVAREAVPAF